MCRWGTDLATGIKPEQQVDKKNPTTAVAAQKPLTEAQWVRKYAPRGSFRSSAPSHWRSGVNNIRSWYASFFSNRSLVFPAQ